MPNNDITIHDVSGQVAFAQVGGNLTGDIIAGNKTIITNIIRQAAKQIVTAPYKFLSSYDISDRDIFFGRNAVIEQLVGNFPRFKTLVINGRSGSGKTSLINAGLIPRLAENGYHYISFREYSDPLRQLQEHVRQDEVFRPFADATSSLRQFLTTVTRQQQMPLVVIFDQFERFFVNVPAALRTQFIQEIKACLLSDLSGQELDLVFALREDFFGAFLIEFETVIPTFFHDADRFNLLPLNPDEARAAILSPLRRVAYKIGYDKAFVDDVLLPGLMGESAAGSAIDPPHLQIVCNQLYQAACERHAAELEQGDVVQIDRALYTHLGETSGILRTYLDDFIDRAAHRDSGGRDVLRSMLKLMLETTGTRKFVSFVDLKTGLPDVQPPAIEQHLREFQDGRIIETRGEGAAARYSLSHEVMVEKVHSWFDERELERKKAQEILERGLAEWKTTQALLNEKQVEHIRTWFGGEGLSAEAEQLLSQSQQAYEEQQRKEAEQERRIRRNRNAFQMALGIGFVIALILSALAFWQRNIAVKEKQRAEQQTEIAQTNLQQAQINEIEALRQSSHAIFLSRNDDLGALLAGLKTGKKSKETNIAPALKSQIIFTLQGVVDGIYEKNRMIGHESQVRSVAFSPNSMLLASGDTDKTIKLWNVADGSEIKTLQGHSGDIYSIAFSPDGRMLASGSGDKTIKLWNISDGEEIITLQGHSERVSSIGFSPDGGILASGSADKTIRLWNVADGREIKTLQGHSDDVSSIVFSPDGTLLASGSGKEINLWDVTNWSKIRTLQDEITSIAFSPDSLLLASGIWDNTIKLWKVADGSVVNTFRGHTDMVFSVAFSPDGRILASGSADNTIKLWNIRGGSEIDTFKGHSIWVLTVNFSPDNMMLASGGMDKTIRLWNIKDRSILRGHYPISNIDFSPDGTLIASGDTKEIKLWDIAEGSELRIFQESDSACLSFSPDGSSLASGNGDGTITLLKVADGKEITMLHGHSDKVFSVAFSPNGKILASGSEDRTIKLWDVSNHKEIMTLRGHSGQVISVSFSPNGSILASGSADHTIQLWEVADGHRAFTLQGHSGWVRSVTFSPDGSLLASGSGDTTIKLWKVNDGSEITTLKGHSVSVNNVRFRSDGMILASGSWDKTIKLWNVHDGSELTTLKGHSGWVNSIAFSPNGKLLASGSSDFTIKLWDLDLDVLLVRGCQWLQGYLKNNPNVSETDRALCDEILKNDSK